MVVSSKGATKKEDLIKGKTDELDGNLGLEKLGGVGITIKAKNNDTQVKNLPKTLKFNGSIIVDNCCFII